MVVKILSKRKPVSKTLYIQLALTFFFIIQFFFNKHAIFHCIKAKLQQKDINKKNVT